MDFARSIISLACSAALALSSTYSVSRRELFFDFLSLKARLINMLWKYLNYIHGTGMSEMFRGTWILHSSLWVLSSQVCKFSSVSPLGAIGSLIYTSKRSKSSSSVLWLISSGISSNMSNSSSSCVLYVYSSGTYPMLDDPWSSELPSTISIYRLF